MRTLESVGACLLVLLAGCGAGGSGDNAANADSTVRADTAQAVAGGGQADESCLVGTYSMMEDGFAKTFTFNADQTGQEVYSANDIRPLTWTLKDAQTIHVIYPAHDDHMESQWDLGFDCGQKTVNWSGAVYHKS